LRGFWRALAAVAAGAYLLNKKLQGTAEAIGRFTIPLFRTLITNTL
jgi:hypothetical protein